MDEPDFEALLEALRGDNPPATIYDDLREVYTRNTNARDSAAAKIAEQETMIESYRDEVNKLKSKNWDLLTRVESNTPDEPDEDSDDPVMPNDFNDMFNFNRKV